MQLSPLHFRSSGPHQNKHARLRLVMFSLGLMFSIVVSLILRSGSMDITGHANNGCLSSPENTNQNQHSQLPLTQKKWCPKAKCHNTDLCHPCSRRFLIVIATGRSASTTLTWMLDELPGVRMAGENNNQLNAILNMKENVWNHTSFERGEQKKTAWGHNEIPPQTFSCTAQSMLETINPPELIEGTRLKNKDSAEDIIGFKTIRFERGSPDHYFRMVDFVKENFSCSRIIVNINSNTTRQMESYHNAKFGEVSEATLIKRNKILKHVSELFGEQAYFLDSAEWTKDVSKLNGAVEWLGFHPSCKFKELLKFNTGGGKGFEHDKTKLSNRDPLCRKLSSI